MFNVESVEQIDRVMPFYRDLLGFRLTDYYSHPFEARFLHVNPRHHSLAFIKTGKTAVHHIMMEVFSFDDMGQGYDIALGSDQVATTLGRHTSDFITSFYTFTPSGFMVEYGWGARSIDPDTWQAFERKEGPSMWGHDRKWLTADAQADARKLRLANAEGGMRRPVQVMEGNYHVMDGVCPWWDSVKDRRFGARFMPDYSAALRVPSAERTRSAMLMRASEAENAFSACSSAGSTTWFSSGEPPARVRLRHRRFPPRAGCRWR